MGAFRLSNGRYVGREAKEYDYDTLDNCQNAVGMAFRTARAIFESAVPSSPDPSCNDNVISDAASPSHASSRLCAVARMRP